MSRGTWWTGLLCSWVGGQPQEKWCRDVGGLPSSNRRWLSISNLIMSSMPLQPERRIWNLCSVLLANDLRNACQEQRRMGCSSSVLIVSALQGSKRVLLYWSPLAHRFSAAEFPLSTHTELSWIAHHKQEAVGTQFLILNWRFFQDTAFTILTLHQRSVETKVKPMVSTWQCFRKVRGPRSEKTTQQWAVHRSTSFPTKG